MYLMLENTKILYFNFQDFTVEVIREELLPFYLRSNIKKNDGNEGYFSKCTGSEKLSEQ